MGKSGFKWLPVCITFLLLTCIVFLINSPDAEAKEKKIKKSGIYGTVVHHKSGEPLEKVYIYGYVGNPQARAAALGIVGITDHLSRGSAADGSYKLDLPPGRYHVVARKRQSGANFGPLSPGDLYDHTLGRKAIVVKKGKYLKCDFKLRMLTEPLFFQGLSASDRVTNQGITGRLLDEDGNHIPGTFAMAYKDDDMYRLPDLASTVTDDEGHYTLYLPKGGRYWIAARRDSMKVPAQGEPFGRYEGSDDYSVVVKDDEFLRGIDITLGPYDGDPPEGYKPVH